MRAVVFLLWVVSLALATQCPTGFDDPDNTGNCYLAHQLAASNYSYAQTFCAEWNATLPMIRTSQENAFMFTKAPFNHIWLGLTCQTSDPLSCTWVDGTPLRAGDYQNFANGHPNPSNGTCIYMDTNCNTATHAQWQSASCDLVVYATCEHEYGLEYSLCPDGSRYFNGNCYFGMLGYSASDGIDKCTKAGGNLASIHSDSENQLVKSVARLLEPSPFTYLGLSYSPSKGYTWSDGTAVDYKNFGFEDAQDGNCVQMSLIDAFLTSGKWINSQCGPSQINTTSVPVNMICKRLIDKSPQLSSNTSPDKCSSTIFLTGAGPIHSPKNNGTNSCRYLVTEGSNDVASVTFSQISLDANSKISFYNNLFDKTPFATISGINTKETRTYNASGNSLSMVYTTTGASENYFNGIYGPPLPFCSNQSVYFGSGTVTSPNYPKNYPARINCQYLLHSSKNRVELDFKTFNVTYMDYLYIYDGYGTFLGQLSSGGPDNYVISSFTNTMRLVFSTYYSSTGFSADFSSIL